MYLNYKKIMALYESFSCVSECQWMVNFLSSILHLLPLNYPIFTCVDPDPYSEYRSGYTNLDPDPQHWSGEVGTVLIILKRTNLKDTVPVLIFNRYFISNDSKYNGVCIMKFGIPIWLCIQISEGLKTLVKPRASVGAWFLIGNRGDGSRNRLK